MLSAILSDLQQNVTELDGELTMLFGEENISNETGGHQIVVVPGKDRYEGPTIAQAQPSTTQRTLRQRWTGVEFHIWGKPGEEASGIDNTDDVEAIIATLVQSLQDTVLGGNYRILAGSWVPPDTGEGGELTAYGRYYVLAVELATPVVRALPQTAVIETEQITLELDPQFPVPPA
ncbi:MAG TPA: hypothetical protein VMB50_20815 [Myxococcales bacterium]|nr:hypothetical protein [Myxococcales bacterium]